MPATADGVSIGFGVESTFRTGVTPTRWLEFLGDESLDMTKSVKQGQGTRVGSRVARSGRRVVTSYDYGGDIGVEASSKGMGLFWTWLMGASTSTLVSGTTYQQVHTIGDNPSSLTIQKGVVQAGGTVDPITFLGAMCSGFEIAFPNDDIVTVKATVDAADMTTATAYTAPTYPSSPSLFSFVGGSISSGTLTAPTTTVAASSTTALANVRGGSIAVDHTLNGGRQNLGAAGKKAKQLHGTSGITGKLDVEYDSATFRDALIADTPLALVLTWTTATALSAGVETLQVVLPEIKFDGELPKANGTELITPGMSFTVLDNLTAAQPMWVVCRTSDSAL
jgi:hypothetical protein